MWIAVAGLGLQACGSGNKDKVTGDSASTTSVMTDSASDSTVKPADSTHSFRNDRGTDSVSAGKSVPAKP